MSDTTSQSDRKPTDSIAPPPRPVFVADEFSTPETATRKRSKKRRLVCFHCNRPEVHSIPYTGLWFYSYVIGFTFGLISLIGPFRCQCCGKQRLLFMNWLHPLWHIRGFKHRVALDSKSGR